MRLIVRWSMGLVALAAAALSYQSLMQLADSPATADWRSCTHSSSTPEPPRPAPRGYTPVAGNHS